MKNSRITTVRRIIARLAVTVLVAAGLVVSSTTPANAGTGTISIDAAAVQGVVQPSITGQMAEWAYDEMNGAWAELLRNRSFETESVESAASNLYDAFTGSTLDRSRWTPMSLDAAPAGTASVSSSKLTETRIASSTGTNAILSMYGGTGAGDFTKFVEFAIEGGSLKVYADGLGVEVTTAACAAISGATVQIVGGASTTTNASGYFVITGVTPATYSLTISKAGYTTYTRSQLEVSATGATTLPIRLVP